MSEALLSTHGLIARYGDFQALYGVDLRDRRRRDRGADRRQRRRQVDAAQIPDGTSARGAGHGAPRRAPGRRSAPHRMVANGVGDRARRPAAFHRNVGGGQSRVAIDHAARPRAGGWTLETVFGLFPMLKANARHPGAVALGRPAADGGDRQGPAETSRACCCATRSASAWRSVVREIYQSVPSISKAGTAIILVEQDVGSRALRRTRLYCMLEGRITLTGRSSEISRDAIGAAYFGASHAVA